MERRLGKPPGSGAGGAGSGGKAAGMEVASGRGRRGASLAERRVGRAGARPEAGGGGGCPRRCELSFLAAGGGAAWRAAFSLPSERWRRELGPLRSRSYIFL